MRQPKKILQDAQACLSGGIGAMETLPTIIKRIIRDGVWRELADKQGDPFHSFQAFVEYKLWWGLETRYERLIAFCKDDAECHQLLLAEMPGAMTQQEAGLQKGKEAQDNVRSYGNSASHTLKRLKRDNPELADSVIRGELSANAAAIQAGFRRPTLTIPNDPERSAESILRHKDFGADFATKLATILIKGQGDAMVQARLGCTPGREDAAIDS